MRQQKSASAQTKTRGKRYTAPCFTGSGGACAVLRWHQFDRRVISVCRAAAVRDSHLSQLLRPKLQILIRKQCREPGWQLHAAGRGLEAVVVVADGYCVHRSHLVDYFVEMVGPGQASQNRDGVVNTVAPARLQVHSIRRTVDTNTPLS